MTCRYCRSDLHHRTQCLDRSLHAEEEIAEELRKIREDYGPGGVAKHGEYGRGRGTIRFLLECLEQTEEERDEALERLKGRKDR